MTLMRGACAAGTSAIVQSETLPSFRSISLEAHSGPGLSRGSPTGHLPSTIELALKASNPSNKLNDRAHGIINTVVCQNEFEKPAMLRQVKHCRIGPILRCGLKFCCVRIPVSVHYYLLRVYAP